MSPVPEPVGTLTEHADVLADAAEDADDPDVRAALRALAAVARGDDPPRDAARRVAERTRNGGE